MANKLRFTKTTLLALEPAAQGKRRWVYDNLTPGLAVQITSSGTKSFYLYRWLNGKPEKLRLGRFPDMSVDQARRAATQALGTIAEGKNPVEERRQAKAEMTLGDLHEIWMGYAKAHKRTWKADQDQFRLYLSPWSKRRLSQIQREHVRALHQRMGRDHGRYAANRLIALLSAMYNYAIREHGLKIVNPCLGLKKFQERKRESWIRPQDMPAFFRALGEEPNASFRDFFCLLLLTGARRGNVLTMRWPDINLEQGLWTIPAAAHKTDRTHTIALSTPAMDILTRRHQTARGEFVFPGTGRTGHLLEPKRAWQRIVTRAGLDGLRLHDLRHTLASWQVTNGVSLAITGRALGHTNTSTTARYAHLETDPVREANERAATAMLEAARLDRTTASSSDTSEDQASSTEET